MKNVFLVATIALLGSCKTNHPDFNTIRQACTTSFQNNLRRGVPEEVIQKIQIEYDDFRRFSVIDANPSREGWYGEFSWRIGQAEPEWQVCLYSGDELPIYVDRKQNFENSDLRNMFKID